MGGFLKFDDAASNDFRSTQLALTGSLAHDPEKCAAVLARFFPSYRQYLSPDFF
jgi:hypothetical protein